MYNFIVVDELILYPIYHLLEQALYSHLLILCAVYCDGGHILIGLDEAVVLLLEFLYLHAKKKYNIYGYPLLRKRPLKMEEEMPWN